MVARKRKRIGGTFGKRKTFKPTLKKRRMRVNARTGGFLGIENKFFDTSFAGSITSSTAFADSEADPATVLCLNAMAQGDGESNRDGRKMVMTSVYVTGFVEKGDETANSVVQNDFKYSVALVLDTQTNGAQLDSESVFVNPRAATSAAGNPLRNLQFTKRFKVLGIHNGVIRPSTSASNQSATTISTGYNDEYFRFSKKLNLPVTFSGTTGVIANVVDNSLHIVALTQAALGINYNARVRFVG